MTKYTGGCHCKGVRFEVEAELKEVVSCNCSICSKRGHLLVFVGEKQFKLLQGKEQLSDYLFNKKHIHHVFCKKCGIGSFGYGLGPDKATTYSINVRCLDGVDALAIPVKHFDGKKL